MNKKQKQQNGLDFLDAMMKNTADLLSILSRMRRADNPADLEIPPKSNGADLNYKNEEQPSFLNQLALRKGLYGIEQEHSDEEERKRIEKMKLLDFDIKQYAIDNDGQQPSTQEMVVMMANAGLSMDDIKSIAGAKDSGTTKPQFGLWESNETETMLDEAVPQAS